MRVTATIILTAVSVASLGAQDTTRILRDSGSVPPPTLYRNPRTAKVLGTILPGAGHMYAGEYLRGYGTWVGTASGIAAGAIIYDHDGCMLTFFYIDCGDGHRWTSRVTGLAMVGLGIWSWISSARDAPRAAERANTRHQSRRLQARPLVEPSGQHHKLNVGAELRW
jgi:hypothetical protein